MKQKGAEESVQGSVFLSRTLCLLLVHGSRMLRQHRQPRCWWLPFWSTLPKAKSKPVFRNQCNRNRPSPRGLTANDELLCSFVAKGTVWLFFRIIRPTDTSYVVSTDSHECCHTPGVT